jgi:hypothetical protein
MFEIQQQFRSRTPWAYFRMKCDWGFLADFNQQNGMYWDFLEGFNHELNGISRGFQWDFNGISMTFSTKNC